MLSIREPKQDDSYRDSAYVISVFVIKYCAMSLTSQYFIYQARESLKSLRCIIKFRSSKYLECCNGYSVLLLKDKNDGKYSNCNLGPH